MGTRRHWVFELVSLGLAATVVGCMGPPAPRAPRAAAVAESHVETAAPRDEEEVASSAPARALAPEDHGCDDALLPETDDAELDLESLDDGDDAPSSTDAEPGVRPFADLSDADITTRLRADVGALGPISIGRAHQGVLIAGVRMPEGPNWELRSPGVSWGTQETIDGLGHAIDAVAARFPDTPRLSIGNISQKGGGHFPPHVSHQSGRDVDVGYYLTEGQRWYAEANASNLDRARTWHLVRTLLADSDVDLILIDARVQRLLKTYALEIGEDPEWLDQVFQVGGKSRRPIILHVNGHATHLHVRFYSPVARELGRRAYPYLLARRLIVPPTRYVSHKVKAGETLSHLALRYKVTVAEIKKANKLTKDLLRRDKTYRIPQTGGIALPPRVVVPARRVPPPVKTAALVAPCRRAAP